MPSTPFSPPLDVAGRRVLVCGAGAAALAPIRVLLAAGAEVVVVGSEVSTTVADLAARNRVVVHGRTLRPDDFSGAVLVVPAAGEPIADQQALQLARARGVLATLPRTAAHPAAGSGSRRETGEVILVGGGPGDLSLLTLGGLDAVRRADVIVTDRLAPLAALDEARPDAVIVDVAKIPRGAYTSQQQINSILIEHAQSGRTVVRLKGGDSFVFGRGGEEWQACAGEGIPVTVLPGVSSAIAAPALAGIPLTHRELTQGFTVVSGHAPPGDPNGTLDWAALARANTTLVILMGVATLPAITAELLRHGMPAATPALTVADAGLPGQFTVRGNLADIAARSHAEGIKPPAVTVIGAVAGFRPG
jgi:uroporphyrin-III C-methyltransferase